MTEISQREMIPISALNALEYCPRKFYYQFVQGEEISNELCWKERWLTRALTRPGHPTTAEGVIQTTRLYLCQRNTAPDRLCRYC